MIMSLIIYTCMHIAQVVTCPSNFKKMANQISLWLAIMASQNSHQILYTALSYIVLKSSF